MADIWVEPEEQGPFDRAEPEEQDPFADDEPLECGIENPEMCESCQ